MSNKDNELVELFIEVQKQMHLLQGHLRFNETIPCFERLIKLTEKVDKFYYNNFDLFNKNEGK